jgi:hypothetical protein
MKLGVLAAMLAASVTLAEAGQTTRNARPAPTPGPALAANVAEAYQQYLLGRMNERDDKIDAAIAAYKRSIVLDPTAADVRAELAGLYLRQNRVG